MKFLVYGIERNLTGNYQGRDWKNHRIHAIGAELVTDANHEGYRVEQIKVPGRIDVSDFHAGDTIEVYYNRFGNVEQVVKV